MKRIAILLVVVAASFSLGMATTEAPQDASSAPRFMNNPGRSDDLPFSNAVLVGNTLYLAGSIGIDPATGAPPDTIKEEVTILMDGVKSRLEMVGMTMDDVVSMTVFCPDLALYDEFNSIYRTYFGDHFPARAFIGSGPLLLGGHFEIQGVAVKP